MIASHSEGIWPWHSAASRPRTPPSFAPWRRRESMESCHRAITSNRPICCRLKTPPAGLSVPYPLTGAAQGTGRRHARDRQSISARPAGGAPLQPPVSAIIRLLRGLLRQCASSGRNGALYILAASPPDFDGDMKDWPRIAKLQSDLLVRALATRQTRCGVVYVDQVPGPIQISVAGLYVGAAS